MRRRGDRSKSYSILVILIIIVILHVILIHLVFFQKGSNVKIPFVSSSPEQKEGKTETVKEDIKQKPETKKPSQAISAMGFNYSNAVKGNIPELPASKKADTGILVDLDTREVLWAKKPQSSVPIASMTKMMTLLLALEKIQNDPGINLDTPVKVSRSAFKIGGSQVWLDPRETFPLSELLKTVAIKSANDSAYLVAEFLAGGDEQAFVNEMNSRVGELKLPGTKFYNSHGLPGRTAAEDNVSTPEGMALLAEELLKYPKAIEWSSTWRTTFRKKKPLELQNHNTLVRNCPGVDGMKTGYIKRAGYCTTVTCKRGGKRLVAVVTGFPLNPKRGRERDNFVRKLLDWGYAKVRKTNLSSAAITKKNSSKNLH